MKFLSSFFILLVLVGAAAGAEITLSGQADAYLDLLPAMPSTSSRLDTLVDSGSAYGFQDVCLNTDVTFRLEAGQEAGAFTLWLAVNPYEMSQLLLAAASGNPPLEQTVAGALLLSDPAALSIFRANIAWYIGQALVLRLGRQSLLTGYGYGWNPMDFASPVKDPLDPEAELRGVDALSLQFYLGNVFALKLSGIVRFDDFISGADFEDLQAAVELTASFPVFELKLSGYYDYDSTVDEDAFVPALGAGLMLDLAGVGVYGEGALLRGGRVPVPVGVSANEVKDEVLASGLLGLEYTFASELRLIAEYFYNGEGYSRQERELYNQSLEDQFASSSTIPAAYLAMYRPGTFARHYLLLNLGYPIYPWKTNLELSAFYSPDSGALGIMPSLELEVSGSLSVRGTYMGMFSLAADHYDEAWFSPFNHFIELRLTYFF